MRNVRTAFCILLIIISSASTGIAQSPARPLKDQLVFSAIKGSLSRQDTIQLTATSGNAKLIGEDASSFKIITQQKGKIILAFAPAADFIGIKQAVLKITGARQTEIKLTGLSTNGLEGENEAPLSTIVDALGYKVNIGWNT